MSSPTNLYQAICERYQATIASTFFGHYHEDLFSISYINNATIQTEQTAMHTAWMGPSVVPLSQSFRS